LQDTQYTQPTPDISVSLADVLARSGFDQTQLTSYTARAAKTAGRAAKVVAGVVSLGVLGGVGAGAWGVYKSIDESIDRAGGLGAIVSGSGGFDMYSFSNSALLPGEGTVAEVVLITDGPDQEHLVYADLGDADPVRWDTSLKTLLPPDASIPGYERIVASPGQVLITYKDRVYAFDRATGTPLYQVELRDSVMNICTDCLRALAGDRVAALSSDGTLQVWDAATGQNGWKLRLPGDAPRQLLDVGGNPAVIVGQPDAADGEPTALVTVYSAADGTVVHTQAPSCDDGAWRRYIRPYDHVVTLADGGYVYLGACPQHWSPGADEPDWKVSVGLATAIGLPAFDNGRALIAGDVIVAATDAGVATVDLSDGTIVEVPRDDVNSVTPIALVGDMIIATEQSSRGSYKWSLVGIDLGDPDGQAQEPVWQVALTGDPGSEGFITDHEWIVGAVPSGIAVIEFDVDASDLSIRIVDPKSGTTTPARVLDLDDLLFADVIGWRNGKALIGADDRIYAIDPATASITASAP